MSIKILGKEILNKEGKKEKVKGMYAIRNMRGDEIYIGQSDYDIAKRISWHVSRIKHNKHRYEVFNQAYKADPKCGVMVEILDIIDDDELDIIGELESKYIEYFKKVGYNVVNISKNTSAKSRVKNKTKMRKAQKWSGNGNAKLTLDEAKEILYLKEYGYKAKAIAEMYDICTAYVYQIGNDKWVGLYDELGDKYIPNLRGVKHNDNK